MIRELVVEGFRGISKADIKFSRGINVLVGKNGSGKSSILEAIYLALNPQANLYYVITRRGWFGLGSVDALFHRGFSEPNIEPKIRIALDNHPKTIEVSLKRAVPYDEDIDVLRSRGLNVDNMYSIWLEIKDQVKWTIRFYIDVNSKFYVPNEMPEKVVSVDSLLIDWNVVYNYGSPENVYSNLIRVGGYEAKKAVVDALRGEYEDIQDLDMLIVNNVWVLHFVFRGGAVPYYVVGDGIKHALMYVMSTLMLKEAVLLMEEPELHTHPSLMGIIANAILKSYRERRNQVILSTHSLELVSRLVEGARRLGFGGDELFVHRVVLDGDGVLHDEVYDLNDASKAIKVGWDVRM